MGLCWRASGGTRQIPLRRVVPPIRTIPRTRRTLKRCTRVNVKAQAAAFAASEPIIAPAVRAGKVGVVAGVYDIGSGRVSLV